MRNNIINQSINKKRDEYIMSPNEINILKLIREDISVITSDVKSLTKDVSAAQANIANVDAVIKEMRNEIRSFNEHGCRHHGTMSQKIDEMDIKIGGINTKINDVENNIEGMGTRINENDLSIVAMKAKIHNLQNNSNYFSKKQLISVFTIISSIIFGILEAIRRMIN